MTPPGRPSSTFPWLPASIAAGLLAAIGFVLHARWTGVAASFPLDDAWIHLTYARTLREHGAFAYFAGGPTTAGSTAPLFTLLEALGFFLTRNEHLLAVALGLAGQALFLRAFARWALRRLGDPRWAALTVLLVGLDGRVLLLAVSGMETSLFLALTALAIESRLARRTIAAGLALGLALWVRPDALVLAAVFAIDALFEWRAPAADESAGGPRVLRGALVTLGVFAGIAAAYAAFNLAIGGHVLPATFAAKTAFYAGRSRFAFLTSDVAECFGSGAWLVLAPFALGAVVREARALARGALRLEAGWALALPLAYLVLLPYSHRFTRYLIPSLPAFALLGVAGLRGAFHSAAMARVLPAAPRSGALALLLAAAIAWHVSAGFAADDLYRYACGYQSERQVRTGEWLATHTPPDAVIATHDVGAIAFYSRRRIVDTVGLVSPEVAPWLGRPGYEDSLAALFQRQHVTHVASFEEWLPVDNVQPEFVANDPPEVMCVFAWDPLRAHLVPARVADLTRAAEAALAAGNAPEALRALREALSIDKASARVWLRLGDAIARSGPSEQATQAWKRARALFPDSPDVARRLAAVADTAATPAR